jgi:hypothetical protein
LKDVLVEFFLFFNFKRGEDVVSLLVLVPCVQLTVICAVKNNEGLFSFKGL